MFNYMSMNMTMFHGLFMFIFWFILIYLILSLFKKDNKNESALDILKKRLANGEISQEEFNSLKKSIS